MNIKNSCKHCGGNVEFGDDSVGADINCPHCGKPITLKPIGSAWVNSASSQSSVTPVRYKSKTKWTLIAVYVFIGLLVVGLLGYLLLRSEMAGTILGGAAGGIVALAVFIFLFVLAILWAIFPMFVYTMLKQMNETLSQIERNTRK